MALTVSDYLEVHGTPVVEVARVSSTASGDYFISKKFHRIKAVLIQNHGATFDAGVSRDSPKITIVQGGATNNAKVQITHTTTTEVFSILLIGEF
jgi:hypothetical protein